MSDQANLMLAYKYREIYRFQAQQMPSKLEFAVERGPTNGEKTRHQLLGKVTPVERTARHQDTPYTPTPHDDRWSVSRNFGSSDLIDNFDKLRTMVEDPRQKYAKAQVAGLNRRKDELLTSAMAGTAITGQTAGGTSGFDSNFLFAQDDHAFDEAGGSGDVGLTYYKILSAMSEIEAATGGAPGKMHGLFGAREKNSLIASTKASSTLFMGQNQETAFRSGELTELLGIRWHLLEDTLITTDSNSDRLVFIWMEDGVALDLNADLKVSISVRHDKWDSVQILTDWTIGAVRLDNSKVAQIECDPTPTL